ncbi:MAG: hypothetical protein K0Q55_2194, partial [Verrucomicrobia bacterium]|nr:hypothetical protein [Verrucomicrobiota bacterium]
MGEAAAVEDVAVAAAGEVRQGVGERRNGLEDPVMMRRESIKYYLAYHLASRLDPNRSYTKSEVETFIWQRVSPDILDVPTTTKDHLRVAMLDLRLVTRTIDDLDYRVSPLLLRPDDTLEAAFEKLRPVTRPPVDGLYRCPRCHQSFKQATYIRHYQRVHTSY